MRSIAEIEAHDIAKILNNKKDTVRNNLGLLAGLPTI